MRSKCLGAKDAVKLPSTRHSANFRNDFKLFELLPV